MITVPHVSQCVQTIHCMVLWAHESVCVCVWLAIHSSATQPALYLLKAICITLTLNYECLLRESDCLLQMRELLSAILFSRLR